MEEKKKCVYSAIQPSGTFTIGNYFGAMKNWVPLQDAHDCLFCLADMHAITVPQVPADLRRRTYECMALLMAIGIDPEKSVLYVQSQVPAHAELAWILNCFSYMGELSRMTQYKDKSKKQGNTIRVGLFDYPVLMAADILLYQADLVPVGSDQKQHVELARDIAERFNQQTSPTFTVPEPWFGAAGARVMSLQDPAKKMSKSDENVNGFVSMLDDPDTVVRKFKRAVTDSDTEVRYDRENKAGVSNLMEIYGCAAGMTMDEVAAQFDGRGYGDFKLAVGEAVAETLKPIQAEYKRLLADKGELENLMKKGSAEAAHRASRTLAKVRKKVGFVTPR
jgi:tryptophanyl-tRNA synthetase